MNTQITDRSVQRKSRIRIIAVFSIFLLPLLLAFVWLQIVKNESTDFTSSSNGELIEPAVHLDVFGLSEQGIDELFDNASLRGVWTLLYFSHGPCEASCQQNLYHMRQIRLSLNQNMDRLQRVIAAASNRQIPEELLRQHVGLRVVSGVPEALAMLENQVRKAESLLPPKVDSIYMIDPLGNLMMRFAADLNPKSILKDIKHLLKVSRIG